MKKLNIILLALVMILTLVGVTACGEEETSVPSAQYKVTYSSNGGIGTLPEEKVYEAGTVVTVANNTLTYEGYDFSGWKYGETIYQAGESYTVPNADTVFTAQWTLIKQDPQPAFAQTSYTYDRLGGGALELPIELDGAGLFYLEINGSIINSANFSYDEAKKVIVIAEDYMLSFGLGDITVTAVTDVETQSPVQCTVTIEQSLKTTFDEQTTKEFVYGKDEGVTFAVGYNGTTPKKLLMGKTVVDPKYYTYGEGTFTVYSEFLSAFSEATEYTLVLSNNDSYTFTVATNVIFATDYDLNTQHDTTASNLGHNPLYQYYDNVSIVDGPDGMSGKVLKITPNTQDVTYDCHGYYTLRASWWDSTWRQVAFERGKYYVFSFDYMTEGTSVGEFCLRSSGTSWKEALLLGEENDGKIHSFSTIVTPEQLGDGIFLWAKFVGGGGSVYVDNYKVAQLDAAPSLSVGAEYKYESGEAYTLTFNAAELGYAVKLNGNAVTAEYNKEQSTLTIPASAMAEFKPGTYSLEITTAVITLKVDIRVIDNRVSTFTNEKAVYHINSDSSVKVYGSFDSTLTLLSLKQIDKEYNDNYGNDWDFAHADETKNYASLVTFVPALDGAGYIEIPKSVADLFWGETQFAAQFSNGQVQTFTLSSAEVPFFTNYDDTTIRGYYYPIGNWKDSPLESGMWGGAQIGVEEREEGNNAWFIKSTEGAAGTCAFSIRMHAHPWEWYTVQGEQGNFYRVTFDYQISNLSQDSVYFFIMSSYDEDQNAAFFGDYDQLDRVDFDRYYKVRYNLKADGQVHTFDSGWFSYNASLRMMQVALPVFTAADNTFVMFDNYRITTSSEISYLPTNIGDYSKGQAADYGFDLNGERVVSSMLDGKELRYTVTDGKLVFDKNSLNALDLGEYNLVVTTNNGIYRKVIKVTDNRISELTEKSKRVVYNSGSVKLAGTFDTTLTVTSLTRQGADTVWDASASEPQNMNTNYITITADALEISADLINQLYKTGKYVVSFSNGKSVEFTLTSNMLHYTNYDETNVYVNIGGNSVICQDSSMRDIVKVNGNNMFKYTPANATLWHSQMAINGNGGDNFVFTFENRNANNFNWYDLYLKRNDTLIFTFDYEVVLGEGKQSYFIFTWLDSNGTHHKTKIEGKGNFYVELPLSECVAWGINCPAPSVDSVSGSYMYIDNLGIGTKDTTYLTETSKNVVYGKGESVILAGTFEKGLTIVSAKRFGNNFWDSSKTADAVVNVDYFTLAENGITVSPTLIDMLYGTQTFWLTLSNNDIVRFELTSNMLHYTNYDEVFVHEASQGNIRSCQCTSMWEVLGDNGDKYIKYTPKNATQGHAVNAMNGNGKDNFVFTFSNQTNNNHWFWEYDIAASSTIFITFKYEVVIPEGLESHFQFTWIDSNQVHHTTALSGSGTFTIELDTNNLLAWGINCPVSSPDMIDGSYMNIDNYGFGIKAE